MTTNTYFPVDNIQTATMMSKINTKMMFPTKVYLSAAVGSTNLTTTGNTLSLNHLDPSVSFKLDYLRAQKYYEITCKKNPIFLLAMAYEIINPKTSFWFALVGNHLFFIIRKPNIRLVTII